MVRSLKLKNTLKINGFVLILITAMIYPSILFAHSTLDSIIQLDDGQVGQVQSFTIVFKNVNISETMVFPGQIVSSKGISTYEYIYNKTIGDKSISSNIVYANVVGNYLVLIQEYAEGSSLNYNLHIISLIDNRRVYSGSLATGQLGRLTFDSTYSSELDTLALYTPRSTVLILVRSLNTEQPSVQFYRLSENEVVYRVETSGDYLLVLTSRYIYVFSRDRVAKGLRYCGNEHIVKASVSNSFIYVVSARTSGFNYILELEIYNLYGEFITGVNYQTIGYVNRINPYNVELQGDYLYVYVDTVRELRKIWLKQPNATLSSIQISPDYNVIDLVISQGYTMIIYAVGASVYYEILSPDLNIEKQISLIFIGDQNYIAYLTSSVIYSNPDRTVYLLVCRSANSILILPFSPLHGVSSVYYRLTAGGNTSIADYSVENGMILSIVTQVEQTGKTGTKTLNYIYVSTIDSNYVKKIKFSKLITISSSTSGVNIIYVDEDNSLKVIGIRGLALGVFNGVESIVQYTSSNGRKYEFIVKQTPYFTVLEAGNAIIRCMPLNSPASIDLYPSRIYDVQPGSTVTIDLNEFYSHLVVKGSNAVLELTPLTDQSSTPIIIEHSSYRTDWYLPPGSFKLKIKRDFTEIGETSIVLKAGDTLVLDVDEAVREITGRNPLSGLLEFLANNMMMILLAVTLTFVILFIVNLLIYTRRS